MADYTVAVEEVTENTVSVQDLINAVTISETSPNSVTVVASTFVNDDGASSSLFYGAADPIDSLGDQGDFYINTASGELWGPKGVSDWGIEPLPLIPKRFVYTQSPASSTWNITHTLNGYPSVTVVDSAGSVVIGDVSYNSTTSLTVSFSSGFAGKAYLT